MIKVEDIKKINKETFKLLTTIYKNAINKSFLQNPDFVILDENKNTCFYIEKNNQLQAFCFVKESFFSKFKKVKSCVISHGIISDNSEVEEELFDYILLHYKKEKFTEITIDFLLNDFPLNSKRKFNLKNINSLNRGTLLIDLTIDFEIIFKNFTNLLKKNYKKGLNSNLIVRELTEKVDFSIFLELHKKLSKNRKIDLISDNQIIATLNLINNNKSGFILGCFKENKLIGGVACVEQGNRIEYYLGVSDPDYRKLPLSHLTLIRAIEKTKEEGYEWFDMGGVVIDAPKENQIHNITNFKLNFSSNFKEYYPKFSIKLNFRLYVIKTIYLYSHQTYFKIKSYFNH
jgi:hypothetical protein